jgi:hypothetical protein
MEDCQNAGYDWDACESSWYNDPGKTPSRLSVMA